MSNLITEKKYHFTVQLKKDQ